MTVQSPTTVPAVAETAAEAPKRISLWRLVRRYPTIVIGSSILITIILVAIFAPFLGTVDPTAISTRMRTREPSAQFWFGTDMLGRDIYSRVLYGARVSLVVGFSVAILASVLGLAIGLVAGFIRKADAIIMRVMDGIMSIPSILLAIARLMALTRGSGRQRHPRHHHRRDPARLAPRPRRGAVPARAALCGCGGGRRHLDAGHHRQAHPAEHAGARSSSRRPISAPPP